MFPPEIDSLARRVVSATSARGLMLATAESCTGGLVAAALTAVPGSSAVLDRGLVTYSNAAKSALLGVPPSLIEAHGAVSEPVARAMAEGARAGSGVGARVDLAVSITGIAGPGGGTEDKPVGLVWFGCASSAGVETQVQRFGDIGREAVRLKSVAVALGLLLAAAERA